MKLEIEVPEIVCCRCNTQAPIIPNALKRTADGGTIVDSAGTKWQAHGASLPIGWEQAPGKDPQKVLCPPCAVAVAKGIENLLKPTTLTEVKTAATSIPTLASPPVVGRVIGASPTPTQAAARVTGGVHIYSNPVQRPEPVVSAPASIVKSPSVSNPIVPQMSKYAPQPVMKTVGTQMVRAPIIPAEKGSNVKVASNTQFPVPKISNTSPVPLRSEVPSRREVSVLSNDEIEPQGPVTTTPVLRGTGV